VAKTAAAPAPAAPAELAVIAPESTVAATAGISFERAVRPRDGKAAPPASYKLVDGPRGAKLDAASGRFTWRPSILDAGKTFTVAVRIGGESPATIDEQTFRVEVQWRATPASAPFTAQEAQEYQVRWANHLGVPVAIHNSLGMKLVLIPPGEFTMGAGPEGNPDEQPQHRVRITRPFYLGALETTQNDYERIKGNGLNPSHFAPSGAGKARVDDLDTRRFPVENVYWEDAAWFCRALSETPNEKGARRVYRLPSEAEWEFACRAGTTALFHTGSTLSTLQANCRGDAQTKSPGFERTTTVGSYPPNPFGLFDMSGNAAEWCNDWYHPRYYTAASVDDPAGPAHGPEHTARGGCWSDPATGCRSARRMNFGSITRSPTVGFRIACSVGSPAERSSGKASVAATDRRGPTPPIVPLWSVFRQ